MKHCRIKVSWLWIPFLLCYPFIPLYKTLLFIFLFLSIHESAHIIVAICFHYPIQKVILYPFGLCAVIDSIGYRSGIKDFLILVAGPLTHLLEPLLLRSLVMVGWISQAYCDYLCMMNLSILVFNLLPIYPLDGGRLLELFLQLIFPYMLAGKLLNLISMVLISCCYLIKMFQGISGLAICILLIIENMQSYRRRPYQRATFYQYRMDHPSTYPIRMNHGREMYRFATNIMLYESNWVNEEVWLYLLGISKR